MRVDFDRQAFAFGPTGTFDALNASIVLSQILAAAQSEQKQVYHLIDDLTKDLRSKHGHVCTSVFYIPTAPSYPP